MIKIPAKNQDLAGGGTKIPILALGSRLIMDPDRFLS